MIMKHGTYIGEIGAQVRKYLFYVICLRHLTLSRAVTNWNFLSQKIYFTYVSLCSELPPYISTIQ